MRAMDPSEPPPTEIALARLEKLTLAGASPDRVIQTIGEIVAAWADEPEMHAETARLRVEQMWDAVSRNVADLGEQLNDFETSDRLAVGAARRTLAALQAAEATLALMLERL